MSVKVVSFEFVRNMEYSRWYILKFDKNTRNTNYQHTTSMLPPQRLSVPVHYLSTCFYHPIARQNICSLPAYCLSQHIAS